MTTEEKAKAYDDALKKIQPLYEQAKKDGNPIWSTYEYLVPKLRDSEDEKRMRAIAVLEQQLHFWNYEGPIDKIPPATKRKDLIEAIDVALSYLEKQKEQKPTSTEDMPYIADEHFYEREPADSFKYKLAEYMTKCCTKKEGPYGYTYVISAEAILKMAEEELLKRGVVQEWSEEDELMRNRCIADLGYLTEYEPQYKERYDAQIAWLKSLRPQPHWKPSEEELLQLRCVISGCSYDIGPLVSLEKKT